MFHIRQRPSRRLEFIGNGGDFGGSIVVPDKVEVSEPNEKAPFLKVYASKRVLLEVLVSSFAADRFIYL